MTQKIEPNESFTYHASVYTEGSQYSDDSDASSATEVDTRSAKFINMMSIINNPNDA